MNKQGFFEFHQDFCKKILDISTKKNSDYTGDTDCPFANFTAVERNSITSTEQGFLVRMTDKMQRINSYVQQGKLLVEDEKVEDTLMDLANYCILMAAYIRSKHDKEEDSIRKTNTSKTIGRNSKPGDFLYPEEYPA